MPALGPASGGKKFCGWVSLFRKRRADADVSKARSCRAMPGAHSLHGLALPAVRRAPKRPVIELADGVARIPEFSGDAAVAGIFQHPRLLAAFDLPADFSGKLELIPAVVDRPGTVGFHQDAVIRVRNQIVERPGPGHQAHISHSNDGEPVPAFRAHSAGRALQADKMRGFPIREIPAKLAVLDNVGALRGNTLVVIGKSAKPGAMLEPRVGNNIDDVRRIAELIELIER